MASREAGPTKLTWHVNPGQKLTSPVAGGCPPRSEPIETLDAGNYSLLLAKFLLTNILTVK
jgi:hypothetical protein